MKCIECGGTMSSARENVKYTASGLPHVTLVGVEVRRCKACGEQETVIPKIEQLHRVLALAVSKKHARLMPEEIRFLRKSLGWSGVDFAEKMGVTPETVSKWENGKKPMGPVAERLLRLSVASTPPVAEYPLDALNFDEKKRAPARLHVSRRQGGWLAASPA